MRIILCTGIILLLAAVSGLSQTPSYSIRNYRAIDGLPQSQVDMMLEDRNGYLWIGTHGGGLARFDGRAFKVYTTLDGMLSNIITHLKLDAQQNLWIVHPRGISKFDGVSFKTFEQPGSPANARLIRRAFELQDTLFFMSSPGHIGKIFDDSVYYWAKPVRKAPLVHTHQTPDGNILLYRKDSTFIVKSSGKEFEMSHKNVFHRVTGVFNYQGNVWLTTDKGRFTIDLSAGEFRPAQLAIRNHIIYVDTLHDVFWTRYGNALMKEKLGEQKIDTVLKDVEVNQVLADSEGNTWFATHGMGLYKYFIQDFNRVGPEDVNVVMAVHRDQHGYVWIGSTTRGLWRIKDGDLKSYLYPDDPYRNEVYSIAESPDGTLWIGTGYGIARYDRSRDIFKWYTRRDGLASFAIANIQFDERGHLYAGGLGGGISYYDGTSFRQISMKDGLTTDKISALHYSTRYKKLFIGNEFGVSSLEADKVGPITISGIDNASVISLRSFRDSLLLIGSAGAGVAIYHPGTEVTKMITTHHGLPSDFIYFVAGDAAGYLWIGTEKGITRLRLDEHLDIAENLHYDYDNGLTGVETNQGAVYLSDDFKLFGLIDGLYQFNDLDRNTRNSFDLHLTAVELFYGQYNIRDYADSVVGFFRLPLDPELPPDRNHITFHYNRVDKGYPKSVKFRYLLENFDKTWSQPSSNNEVTYSNLPPGHYIFRVMATDHQGSWAPATVAYAFTVKTPFYKTTSFMVGLFILFAGIATLIMYVRVKNRVRKLVMMERIRAKEQESLRKEIARDFHDEMGNQLTRIINYVSLLKLNGSVKNGSQTDLYSKVEDSAKYLYTGTRDFIWSIDPGNDQLCKLFLHIRDFGEKLFEEKNISFRAYNEVKEDYKLPYGFSREANLIFKEAMTNAFKYSAAKNVSLTLVRVDNAFEMSFEDDGIGFYAGDIPKTNGLRNIRERADRIRAVLRIHSVKDQGTRIALNFKLNKTLKYGLTV